jgi:hypothetical protein
MLNFDLRVSISIMGRIMVALHVALDRTFLLLRSFATRTFYFIVHEPTELRGR